MLPLPFLAGAAPEMPTPGEGVGIEPGHVHKVSKSMWSSVLEELKSSRLGSTVFVRSKSPENDSSRGMETGPMGELSNGFVVVLGAGTGVSEGANVAPGSGGIGAKPDSNWAGMF